MEIATLSDPIFFVRSLLAHAKINGIAGAFVIGNCNDRTCTATVSATPDQIKNSNGMVTLSP